MACNKFKPETSELSREVDEIPALLSNEETTTSLETSQRKTDVKYSSDNSCYESQFLEEGKNSIQHTI